MKSLLKLEWKRYLITLCIIMVMMIIRTNLCHEGFLNDKWEMDSDGIWEFVGYDLEQYEERKEDAGFGAISVSDILPVITETYIWDIPVGVFLVFVFVDDFVKRKKKYDELEKTFPVKTWKRYLFYYLADALLIILPCCGDAAYRYIAMKMRLKAVGIEIPWMWKFSCRTVAQIAVFIMVILAVFSFVRMLVVNRMWKLPIGIAVFLILNFLVFLTPADSFWEKCVSIMVDDEYNLGHYYIDGVELNDYTDDELTKIVGSEYKESVMNWYNIIFSEVDDEEKDRDELSLNKLSLDELYKGELNPEYQVLYHGEPIQKDYVENFVVESNQWFRYCSLDLYRFDVSLCQAQQRYENYELIYDIIRVIIALVLVTLMCGLSGKCYGQKSITYFTWARYLAGVLVGIMMFAFCKFGLDDVHIAIVALEAIVSGVACIWLLTPERKRIFAKRKERIM